MTRTAWPGDVYWQYSVFRMRSGLTGGRPSRTHARMPPAAHPHTHTHTPTGTLEACTHLCLFEVSCSDTSELRDGVGRGARRPPDEGPRPGGYEGAGTGVGGGVGGAAGAGAGVAGTGQSQLDRAWAGAAWG